MSHYITRDEFSAAVARIQALEESADERAADANALRLEVLVKLARIETILKLGFMALGAVGTLAGIVFAWWLGR